MMMATACSPLPPLTPVAQKEKGAVCHVLVEFSKVGHFLERGYLCDSSLVVSLWLLVTRRIRRKTG